MHTTCCACARSIFASLIAAAECLDPVQSVYHSDDARVYYLRKSEKILGKTVPWERSVYKRDRGIFLLGFARLAMIDEYLYMREYRIVNYILKNLHLFVIYTHAHTHTHTHTRTHTHHTHTHTHTHTHRNIRMSQSYLYLHILFLWNETQMQSVQYNRRISDPYSFNIFLHLEFYKKLPVHLEKSVENRKSA